MSKQIHSDVLRATIETLSEVFEDYGIVLTLYDREGNGTTISNSAPKEFIPVLRQFVETSDKNQQALKDAVLHAEKNGGYAAVNIGFNKIKIGDTVTRILAGGVPMQIKVSAIDDTLIHCGPWKFSRKNGAEIDEELGWSEKQTGSYLKLD